MSLPVIPGQDLLVHPAERRCWIGAQLVTQALAYRLVGVEHIRLPAIAVMGRHELPGQALVERTSAHGIDQLDEHVGVPTDSQRRVVAVQLDGEPLGL